MKYKKIPPTLNINTINPIINFSSTPFKVASKVDEWKRLNGDIPLRAGISSFGYGGVNSHILIAVPILQ